MMKRIVLGILMVLALWGRSEGWDLRHVPIKRVILYAPLDSSLAAYGLGVTGGAIARAGTAWYKSGYGTQLYYQATNNVARIEANGLLIEGAATNYCLYSRDFTDVSWVKTGGGGVAALKDQTGIDGVANSASKLTASGASGTALQTFVLGAADYNFSICAKRITGSGAVDITDNNGANWTTITLTTAWQCFDGITRNQANPVVGVRLTTSGDVIAVDMAQLEGGKFRTSPVPTTAGSAARVTEDVRSVTIPQPTDINTANGMMSFEVRTWYPQTVMGLNVDPLSLSNATETTPYYAYATSKFMAYDSTNNPTESGTLAWAANTTYKMAFWWNSTLGQMGIIRDGAVLTLSAATFDGTLPLTGGLINIPGNNGATVSGPFWVKNIRIWQKDRGSAAGNNAFLQGVK